MAFTIDRHFEHLNLYRELLVCVKLELWMDAKANLLLTSTSQLRFVCLFAPLSLAGCYNLTFMI